jgi:non-specific protein-tyrosine kinase
MELRQYLSVLRKWLWLIILVGIVAGAASYYATSQMPNRYLATAKVMVGESYQKANPTAGDIATGSVLAETYIQLVSTTAVLDGARQALGTNLTVGDLRGAVSANTIQRTQFLEVRASDVDPNRAADIANAVANQLILLGPSSSNVELAQQREFVRGQISDLEEKIGAAESEISSLEESLRTTTSVREADERRAEIDRLRAQIAQYQENYTQFINFLVPASLNTLSILEPAEAPWAPYFPNMFLNVTLAVIIGMLLATAVAFLIEYLDDTLKNKEDVTRVLGASTLGEIGVLRGKNDRLITASEPRSANAEAYRMLRSNISFSSVDKPIETILVTSASPSEGKSITAANLAVTMAQAGYRTIVLDCDLRKPTQHKIFGVSNDAGLTNSLLAHANLNSFIRPTRVENLRVLTTGPLPPNPAELLGSRSMNTFLGVLNSEADVVVIDSPPILAVTDSAILARLSDGVLLVVDSGKTKRESAQRAREALDNAGARLLGVVINRMPAKGSYYSYNSKYYSNSKEPSTGRSTATTPSSS